MIALLLAAAAVPAYYQSSPERQSFAEDRPTNHWEADYLTKLWSAMHRDFGETYLYAAADRALPPPRMGEKRVVFLGDSITDLWDLSRYFPGKPYINRGIGGQVTAQLVLRFHQDVIALQPNAVVILAGINDIYGALQRESDAGIEANWEAMADMADAHGIKVVFGAILPVNNYSGNASDMLAKRDPKRIRELNAWLSAFCRRRGYVLADYYRVTVDRDGLLQRDLTRDGLHPLANGYARMASVVEAALQRAID
ncbi:GDSL-type esterase/lipase family protein [Sphingomonas crusticola]|uniref:GDSL-type esterase/lipase family protein n=1 Tax=Sphingomonas crusticola TaxID=1697973 RepID=UPI000E224006|nr:GDSL-type esterase/lipase family protein [Sphingomonas crusticola]